MDNRNFTDMSFDEIFPEVKLPEENNYSVYGSNELTDDDSVHLNYDTDCEVRVQEKTEKTADEDTLNTSDNCLNFTDNAYKYNTYISNRPTVPPKMNNYTSFANGTDSTQGKIRFNIPLFNNTANNGSKNMPNVNICLLMGILALIFSFSGFSGFGFFFAIITFVMVSRINKDAVAKGTETYRKKWLAQFFAVLSIIIFFLLLF